MFALYAASVLAGDDTDFDAFAKAVTTCDKIAVSKTVSGEGQRHSEFLIAGYKEQRDIATQRADLADRRRRLRSGEKTGDTDAALTLAGQALDDRQRALEDQRTLDRMKQDMVSYFRQQYLAQCTGRGV